MEQRSEVAPRVATVAEAATVARLLEALADDPVRLHELPGVEHFGLIDPLSPAWQWVVESLAELIRCS